VREDASEQGKQLIQRSGNMQEHRRRLSWEPRPGSNPPRQLDIDAHDFEATADAPPANRPPRPAIACSAAQTQPTTTGLNVQPRYSRHEKCETRALYQSLGFSAHSKDSKACAQDLFLGLRLM
jgi:hypothetical protein